MFSLSGQKALVVGAANEDSIAWGCAQALRAQGADLALTWPDEQTEPHVRPLAERLGARIMAPLNVTRSDQLEALFQEITDRWGRLDTLVHAVAFAPKDDLQGRLVDCSAESFARAMDISVHSFLRMIRLAEPLMPTGGTCLCVSFLGLVRYVDRCNAMAPVRAALESAVRNAAAELGPQGISVHALSPGPLSTRAASGIDHFDELLRHAAARTPTHQLATIADVGAMAAFLASRGARNLTGGIHAIGGGHSITI